VYVIPREVFDARLVQRAVERGAELRREKIVSVETVSHGNVPNGTVSHENSSYETVLNGTISARIVVGADGAHSVVRAKLGLPHGRRAIAIRGYAPTPADR